MKKRVITMISVLLILVHLFVIPSQAVTMDTLIAYLCNQGAHRQHGTEFYLGGVLYWRKMIETGKWTGEKRPEPLMGDANIDGKVTAVDALFALHFSVNGNLQTEMLLSLVKTPVQTQWRAWFFSLYQDGVLQFRIDFPEVWETYCMYNSPFFADVTKDCNVTANDALEILKYCVGKAEDFPVGDFTHYNVRFSYYPWPTEYYPEIFTDLGVGITDEEFCEKYNFSLEETPTDIQ